MYFFLLKMEVSQTIPTTCSRIHKIGRQKLSNCYFKYYYCDFQKCIYRISKDPLGNLEKIRPHPFGDFIWYMIHRNQDCWFNIEHNVLIQELKKILKKDDITLKENNVK